MLEVLKQGCVLMAMGMGTVVSFLVILIITMVITNKVLVYINKFFPEVLPEDTTSKKPAASNDVEVAIAIAATKAL